VNYLDQKLATSDHAPAMTGWRRPHKAGRVCQVGGCGIAVDTAYDRSARMWFCPYHQEYPR
jgi:hypothetical protein